jgi:Ca-activated chloride channel homolog
MNPFGLHALGYAWLALLLAPLVLFYFLKLKRPRHEIPSLALWRQVMQDRRVNAPFQRFKRNLLLLLQILILLLLVLAALQPFWRGGARARRRVPVLVDCSASMGALDKPGGTTRLAEAQRRVRELIDGLAGDQELCLVSFHRAARRLCGFTSNKRLLREALEAMAVEPQPADLEAALRLVQGLARAEPFDEVLLFSDGNFPPRANVDLSFRLDYQQLPAAGPNLGMTALTAQRAVDGGWNVFAQIEGSGEAEGNATVELTRDGVPAGSERITVARGRAQRLLFRVGGETSAVLRVQLQPDGFDSLALDGAAELHLPVARPLRVFVPHTLGTYRRALEGIAGVELLPSEGGGAAVGPFDLVVSDRKEDLAIPARTRLTVGRAPPEAEPLLRAGTNGTKVVDWRRDSALLQHVELSDLAILDDPRFAPNASEGDLEKLGYEALVHGAHGPLMLQKRDADTLSLALLFHTDRSTLPYRVGFPILVANVVRAALEQAGLAEVQGSRSLLSSAETSLAAADRLEFNERLAVAAATVPIGMERALWPGLALAALGVLLFEWWYFQRKPGGWS